jgi:ribosomal protein S18 acetylase RimI-like enzyme
MSLQWTESTEALDWEELAALYRAAPLGDKTPADLKLVFSNSMFHYFAFEHGKLIAAGRVLADGRDCAYLCDIAVLPSHQGRGLGKEIVSRLVERSQAHRKVILYAVPGRGEPLSAVRVSAHAHGHGDFRGPEGRVHTRLFVRDLKTPLATAAL